MKTLVTIAVLSVSSALLAQQPVIDQEQPAIDNHGYPLDIGGSSTQQLAQTFTAQRTGFLTHVTVPVSCDAKAEIFVSINDVTATGEPGPTVLVSETIPGAAYPAYVSPYSTVPAAGTRIVQFFAPAKVVGGSQYAVVLVAKGDCAILPAIKGDYYADGHGYFDALPNPPGWLPLGSYGPYDDLPFQTFVVPRD